MIDELTRAARYALLLPDQRYCSTVPHTEGSLSYQRFCCTVPRTEGSSAGLSVWSTSERRCKMRAVTVAVGRRSAGPYCMEIGWHDMSCSVGAPRRWISCGFMDLSRTLRPMDKGEPKPTDGFSRRAARLIRPQAVDF